jgi:RES domain-containing protein
VSNSIIAYRVSKEIYAPTADEAFSGEGSRLTGGRWNLIDTPAVYTSWARSLAILETLVHLVQEQILSHHVLYTVTIPMDLIENVMTVQLSKTWRTDYEYDATQQIGDEWFRSLRTPVLRVPSSIVEDEDNFVLNPLHPKFKLLKLSKKLPMPIDPRLLR